MNNGKLKAMVMASFLGDSLALPVHWIYDTSEIDQRFGRVEQLLEPPSSSYHQGKRSGEFTHYGDQAMLLLESIAANSGYDLDSFAQGWRKFFEDYKGYFDHATKATLQNFAKGKLPVESGSSSTDLAGASRIAPLVYLYADEPAELIASSRSQTAMTHNNSAVIDSAEFFSRVMLKILSGAAPLDAFKELTEAPPGNHDPFRRWLDEALASLDKETRDAISRFGKSCATEGAFRSVVYLAAKYQSNVQEGLIENVMAGGDSAARGLLLGMILGAHNGIAAMPEHWMAGMKSTKHISQLLDKIDSAKMRA